MYWVNLTVASTALLYALYRQVSYKQIFHLLGSRILTYSSRKSSGSSIPQEGCVNFYQFLKLPLNTQGSSRELEGKNAFKTLCSFTKWKQAVLFSGK